MINNEIMRKVNVFTLEKKKKSSPELVTPVTHLGIIEDERVREGGVGGKRWSRMRKKIKLFYKAHEALSLISRFLAQ